MDRIVNVPVCPLYKDPRPGGELADQALLGTAVETLESALGLRRVRTDYGYEGWAPAEALACAPDWALREKKTVFYKHFAPIFTAPDVRAPAFVTLPMGARAAIVEETGAWTAVELPDGRRGWTRAAWLAEYHTAPPDLAEDALRHRLVAAALRYRGTPYLWGGKTPLGMDCSGLVFMACWFCGVRAYRDARLEPGFDLVEIDPAEKKPGDALFFPGHVALYLGRGRYLHATGKAGSDGVCLNSLDPAAPDYREDLAQTLKAVGSYKGFRV